MVKVYSAKLSFENKILTVIPTKEQCYLRVTNPLPLYVDLMFGISVVRMKRKLCFEQHTTVVGIAYITNYNNDVWRVLTVQNTLPLQMSR